jgi:hypothetical protein
LLSPLDNHDVISLKLFELTVERTPEEEKLHRDVFLPSVDNMKLPESECRVLGSGPRIREEFAMTVKLGVTLFTAFRVVSYLCSSEVCGTLAPPSSWPAVIDEQQVGCFIFKLSHLERRYL